MVAKELTIVIEKQAANSLKVAYLYIKKDSLQNAENVRSALLNAIKELSKNPEKHPPDKYRLENDGSFRAFELYKYRITYFISQFEIKVVRIRHTKMNPLEY